MHRYVALLRGINVGGRHRLPMRDLVEIVRDAGGERVGTYIQSGNALFDATDATAKAMPGRISQAIEERLGFPAPVILRSAAELGRVARNNPYLPDADPKALHVMFFGRKPAASRLAELDPSRGLPDTFAVSGSQIYLYLPNGVARTKLGTDYFGRLGVEHTGRNWRTVLKLAELVAS